MVNLVQNTNTAAAAQAVARNNRVGREGSGQGFENLLNNVSQNDRGGDDTRNNLHSRTNRAESAGETRNDNRQRNGVENTVSSENSASASEAVVQETAENAVVAEVEVVEEVSLTDEEANAMMAEIAAILGISVADLQTMLENLEMSIEDLFVAENRIALLLAAKGLENQAQLLTYPEALPLVKEMTQVATNFETNAENPQGQENVADILPILDAVDTFAEVDAEEIATTAQTATANIVPEAPQTAEPLAATGQVNMQADIAPQVAVNLVADAPPQTAEVNYVQTAGTSTAQATVSPQNIVQQIVQNVKVVTGEQMAEIRIQLRPEHLGDLTMRIATVNGIVTAQFVAESMRVKELIEAGFTDLRDALEQAGINIADIEVNVQSGENPHFFDEAEAQISNSRIQDILAAAMAEEADEAAQDNQNQAVEENIVDYRV